MKGCRGCLGGCLRRISCFGCLFLLLICLLTVGIPAALDVNQRGTRVITDPIQSVMSDQIEMAIATAADGVIDLGIAVVAEIAPETATPLPQIEEFCSERIPVEVVDVRKDINQAVIRSGPAAFHEELERVPLGTRLNAIGRYPGVDGTMWVKVLLEEGNGWIVATAISPQFSCAIVPVTPTLAG